MSSPNHNCLSSSYTLKIAALIIVMEAIKNHSNMIALTNPPNKHSNDGLRFYGYE